jgi:hypothetical protein
MPITRTQKISFLRDGAKWFRQEAVKKKPGVEPWNAGLSAFRHELSADLLSQEALGLNARTAIIEAIAKFEEAKTNYSSPSAGDAFGLEINHLRFMGSFFSRGSNLFAADELYRAFAGRGNPVPYPEEAKSNRDFITGLKILSRSDPEWSRFVFSHFPYDNIGLLPPEDVERGIIGRVFTQAGRIEISGDLAIDETAVNIAGLYEKLFFNKFLGGFFVYPIFTEACIPFEVDLNQSADAIKHSKGHLGQIRRESDNDEEFNVRAIQYFDMLRCILREADISTKICFHYESRQRAGRGNPYNNTFMWDPSRNRARAYFKIAEEMLSLAHLFELTRFGKAYVNWENHFLEQTKSDLSTTEASFRNIREDL